MTPKMIVTLIILGWTWADITWAYPWISEDEIRSAVLHAIGVDTVHTSE